MQKLATIGRGEYMTEFFAMLTAREKEIVGYLIEQIKANGEYIYTVRQLTENLKLHHKTLGKALEKAKNSGYFEIEDLGLRKGYRIKFSKKFNENFVKKENEEEINTSIVGLECLQSHKTSEISHQSTQNIENLTETIKEAKNSQNNQTGNIKKLIGRNKEVEEILKEIKKRKDVLLIGDIGIGKTAILKEIFQILNKQNQKVVYADYARSFKQFLVNIIQQMHCKYQDIEIYEMTDKKEEIKSKDWKDIKRKIKKLTTNDLAGLVQRSITGKDYIIICDALEMITPTAKSIFESFRENCCLVGATHTIRDNPHLKKLWWRFKQIEIKKLEPSKANELIDHLYFKNGINAYDKEAYKRKILKVSNGNCAAIYDMVFHSSKEKYLDHQAVRDIKSHDGGNKELDLTPFVIFAGVGVVATRFIALGMNNKDIYILAGISGALFMFVRFYMMKGMRK